MRHNSRNDQIRDNVTRMRRAWAAERQALAPHSLHHWLIINCDACGTVVDLDLRVKPRDPEASIRVALRGAQCPRCNGHGRPRIVGLAQHPTM